MSVTLDTLAFDSELLIQREIDLPVSLNLCARPGVALADVKTVVSFPHAIAQCRGWLAKKLPDAESRASHSTSDAARRSRSRSAPTSPRSATRSRPRSTASRCSRPRSRTIPRTRPGSCSSGRGIPAPTGHDKTSIVCFQRQDRPGSLLGILQEFAARAVNLTKLESRPTKRGLGDYCFFIDCEGHIADEVDRRRVAQPVGEAGRGEVPRLVSGRRTGRGRGRAAPGGRAGRGSTRRRGSSRCAARFGRRTSDRSEATARRRRSTAAASNASGCASRLDRRGARSSTRCGARSRSEVDGLRARQNAASKEIGKAAPERTASEDRGRGRGEAGAGRAGRSDARGRRVAARAGAPDPEPGRPSVPDGGEDDGEVVKIVGERRRRARARPCRARRVARLRRHRARRRGERARGSRTSCAKPRCWSSRS